MLRAALDGKFAPEVTAQIDPGAIGLLGFSMGGYGSLTTAGVPLDPAAPAYAQFPPAARAMLLLPDPLLAQRVKAVAPQTPIILLTGVLFDPAVIKGPAGEKIACYIEKTAPLDHILKAVKRYLPQ